MFLLYLILVYSEKPIYLRFIILLETNIRVNISEFSYKFECNYASFYVNIIRFPDVTDYNLQVKSNDVNIIDVASLVSDTTF
jgi:hypothetical protein